MVRPPCEQSESVKAKAGERLGSPKGVPHHCEAGFKVGIEGDRFSRKSLQKSSVLPNCGKGDICLDL